MKLSVRILGAAEDLPRLVEIRGPMEGGALQLVLRPRDLEGLAVVEPRKKGAPALVWQGLGSDAPGELVPALDVRFWKAQLKDCRSPVRGVPRAVVAGTWRGVAVVVERRVEVTLTREWKNHGRLTIQSGPNGWSWAMSRATLSGDQAGTAQTLVRAVEAGLAAAAAFGFRKVPTLREAPSKAPPKAPPQSPGPQRARQAEQPPKAEPRAVDPKQSEAGARARAPKAAKRAKASAQAGADDAAPTSATIYDGQGRSYSVRLRVLAAALDGSGPVVPSNHPASGRPIPGYPPAFQARSLESFAEQAKIRQMAQTLEPARLLVAHADATLGPPVVWEAEGRFYVLAGNGRTLALLKATEEAYGAYLKAGRANIDTWPRKAAPAGARWILVRELRAANGGPLSQAQAETFAGASQVSTSAAESPLGRAQSVLRGLGLRSLAELPPMAWRGILTSDNIGQFVVANKAFVAALIQRLDPAQGRKVQADGELLTELVSAVLVGSLPEEIRRTGFVSEKEERALMAALPILVSLDQAIAQGQVRSGWAFMPRLSAARDFAHLVRVKSDAAALVDVERAAQQEQLPGVTTLWDELPALGVLLGLVLKRASRTRDPALTVEALLRPYLDAALSDAPGQSYMFGAPPQPAEVLAQALGVRLPKKVRAA